MDLLYMCVLAFGGVYDVILKVWHMADYFPSLQYEWFIFVTTIYYNCNKLTVVMLSLFSVDSE